MMSIAAIEAEIEIGRSKFARLPVYGQPEIAGIPSAAVEEEEGSFPSSSSSSIGKNSESWRSDGGDSSEEKEVVSAYKGPLSALDSLESALPMRRGISNFYEGKSKSFASLSDAMASCTSARDFVKPENAYTRKRRNLIAANISGNLLRSSGGIAKRLPTSRSTLGLAVAMNNCRSQEEQEKQHKLLPPLHPQGKVSDVSPIAYSPALYCSFSGRSFSLTDLQGMTASGSSNLLKDNFIYGDLQPPS